MPTAKQNFPIIFKMTTGGEQMHQNQTMLYLHNGDTITYLNDQCSIQTIVHILEAKGYSVVVHLYPQNVIKNLTNNELTFAVAIGDALLIIPPPPRQLSQRRWRAMAGPPLPVPCRVTPMAQHWGN